MKKKGCILLSLFCCFSTFSQNSQLVENTWYMDTMVVGGLEYLASENTIQWPITFSFFDSSPTDSQYDTISTGNCDSYFASVIFDDSNASFMLSNVGITLGCITFLEFDQLYYDVFLKLAPDSIFYAITNNNGNLKLTLSNSCGDIATYNNFRLNSDDYNIDKISIFANSNRNEIFITSDSRLNNYELNIYNISGKIISKEKIRNKNTRVDISNLHRGIYIAELTTEKGKILKKFIKS